ncbi:MAG: hypothetical protein JXA54_01140 [Candidatus Heimdallarchaeota archaeon]|nr:hypothetical protein [Candidatus Heimdallarchaeota archaeon]
MSYIILAFAIVGLTQLVWYVVEFIPRYPFGEFENGYKTILPWIETESFWEII